MKDKIKYYLIMYFKIAMGSALYAAGFQFFTYPNDIVPGGVTGIAMIINYLTTLPVGVLSIIIKVWNELHCFIPYGNAPLLRISGSFQPY